MSNIILPDNTIYGSIYKRWILEGKPGTIRQGNIEYFVNWGVSPSEPIFIAQDSYGTVSDHYIDSHYNDTSF